MTPYLGQIEIFAFDFAPKGWAPCNGQLMSIMQNQALFAVLGTAYGGNGTSTFGLPNLQGRVPMGQGSGYIIGQVGGEANHTLNVAETPTHIHTLNASNTAPTSSNVAAPSTSVALAQTIGHNANGSAFQIPIYAPDNTTRQAMSGSALSPNGGQAHNNMMPGTVMNFCIALSGIFPSQG